MGTGLLTWVYSQCPIEITVKDENKEPIIGAYIIINENTIGITDVSGKWIGQIQDKNAVIRVRHIGFETLTETLVCEGNVIKKEYILKNTGINLKTVVISSSREEKKIFEVPASVTIVKGQDITRKGYKTLEDAMKYVSGVSVCDGQTSIRGGSGFAYGVGSRVFFLLNEFPMISGDAGDVKWSFLPTEMISKIEIIKSGASVIYGSSALNGVISISTIEEKKVSDTSTIYPIHQAFAEFTHGIYDNPQKPSYKWWKNTNPTFSIINSVGNLYLGSHNIRYGIHYLKDEGYRLGETEQRIRATFFDVITPKKSDKFIFYIGGGAQIAKGGLFLLWQNADSAYYPRGGIDTPFTSLTFFTTHRAFLHGKTTFFASSKTKLILRAHHYIVQNLAHNTNQSSLSNFSFGELQLVNKSISKIELNSGIVSSYSNNVAELFGNHYTYNGSFYALLTIKPVKLLTLEGGFRLEHFRIDTHKTSYNGLPFFSVFRGGITILPYEWLNFKFNYSGGYRFPSIAEKYANTSVSSLNIFPNPQLKEEKSHNIDGGVRIAFQSKQSIAYFDLSLFYSKYYDMIEYSFGAYIPDSLKGKPIPANALLKYLGFKPQNMKGGLVKGFETLLYGELQNVANSKVNIAIQAGYTYLIPLYYPDDTLYINTLYDKSSPYLKYRNKHLFVFSLRSSWHSFSIEWNGMIRSKFENIDSMFVAPLIYSPKPPPSFFILPGFGEWWQKYHYWEKIFNVSFHIQIAKKLEFSCIIGNIMNREIIVRPGYLMPPRDLTVKIRALV